jgi:actin, other eukaryote
MEEVWSNIY